MNCIVSSGIPRPLIFWRRANSSNPIPSSTKVKLENGQLNMLMAEKVDAGSLIKWTHVVLLLKRIIWNYQGIYECVGSNVAGEDVKQVKLVYAGKHWFKAEYNISFDTIFFLDLPIVSIDRFHQLVSPGDDVNLTCNVTSDVLPDIKWFKDDKLVSSIDAYLIWSTTCLV